MVIIRSHIKHADKESASDFHNFHSTGILGINISPCMKSLVCRASLLSELILAYCIAVIMQLSTLGHPDHQ